MRTFLIIIFGFLLATVIILLVGGGIDFLAGTARELINSIFGLESDDFATSIVLIFVFLVLAILLIPIILLFRTRFRQPIVFISFKHIHEDKAVDLEKNLLAAGFKVERVAFSSNYKHDEVVGQVLKKIQKSDAVVAIPDSENASFVDSELLAASALKLPIILFQYTEKQAQPGTLLLGYPVLNYQCIQKKQFLPLYRFLYFATRHQKDFWNQTGRILRQVFDPLNLLVFGLIAGIFLLIKFGVRLIRWLLLDVMEWGIGNFFIEGDELNHYLFVFLILGFTIYSIGKAFYTLQVARQTTITGKESYKVFQEEFSFLKKDKEMMECIKQNRLKAKGNAEN